MKLLNKNRKVKSEDNQKPIIVFQKAADAFERWKITVARCLTQASERVTLRTKKLILVAFGIVVSAMSLSLMLSPFSKHTSTKLFSPVQEHGALQLPPGGASAISQEDFNKMISFRRILDSLKVYDSVTYRILIHGRHGLVDSIDYLIRYRDER